MILAEIWSDLKIFSLLISANSIAEVSLSIRDVIK